MDHWAIRPQQLSVPWTNLPWNVQSGLGPSSGRYLGEQAPAKEMATMNTNKHRGYGTISHPISFTLVVDNFGVKYERQEDVNHFVKCVKSKYNLPQTELATCIVAYASNRTANSVHLTYPCRGTSKSSSKNTSTHPLRVRNTALMPQYQNSTTVRPSVPSRQTLVQQIHKACPVGDQEHTLLCLRCQLHSPHGAKHNWQQTGQRHGKYNAQNKRTPWLLGDTSQHGSLISWIRHDTQHPFWCIIPIRGKYPQQNVQAFFHGMETTPNRLHQVEWCVCHAMHDFRIRHPIRPRSRT